MPDVIDPGRLSRLPDSAGKSYPRSKVGPFGGIPELLQFGIAQPSWARVQSCSVRIWNPSLPECPAGLFANSTKDDFQSRREIAGCRHFHRDRLKQTKFFFAFLLIALS